ncbi:beta-galactosidase [Kiritimatiella glycovorans]|uniref:Glycoside hydrolase family 42 N-terminal domain-containing protein n=1 Tax=Kiritimatiella glycovorans TaxID=1307763 RepID=A0A0G3EKM8_9BACT|nr:beta-galactosidase [Kiritimatiella glycovorans]AKJ64734.1 hypothetical protein L21SP4_01489 [Kiritimatiella glycovorans]
MKLKRPFLVWGLLIMAAGAMAAGGGPDTPTNAVAFPETRLDPFTSDGPRVRVEGHGSQPFRIYFGNNQFDKDEIILEEMHKARDAGVRVLSVNVGLPEATSPEKIRATLDYFFEPFPEALILLRVWLGPSETWHKKHPEERFTYADGSTTKMASPASEVWRKYAHRNVRELLDIIADSPYADRFIGLIPLYYLTGEWQMWHPEKSGGYSAPMTRAFRAWARETYGSIGKVNKVWGTELESFREIEVPSRDERYEGEFGIFRNPATQQKVIDFTVFMNNLIPDVMGEMAATIKDATAERSLVGYFFGYLFEHAWTGNWPQQIGHLGTSRLLACPDVDFFGSAYSYNMYNRRFGFPMDVHGPRSSGPLHGKAVFLEEDTFTHLAEEPDKSLAAPGYPQRTTHMEETMAVLKRNMGLMIAQNEFPHWQNLLSDGRFNDKRIWNWYDKVHDLIERASLNPAYEPSVAVVLDEKSYTWQRVPARAVYGRWVYETRMALSRTDAALGWYLQSDLDRIPESVRCVILLTPYHLDPAEKNALRRRWMKDGRMIVFCYLPDLFRAGKAPSLTKFTGIGLELHRDEIDPESRLVQGTLMEEGYDPRLGEATDLSYNWNEPGAKLGPVSPWLHVEDEEAEVFARYIDEELPSCAMKEMDGWTSVYLGTSRLTPRIWRELFRRAGCHLYLDEVSDKWMKPDFIQASPPFLMVQSFRGGRKTVYLPHRASVVGEWRDGETRVLGRDTDRVDLDLRPGHPAYILWRRGSIR